MEKLEINENTISLGTGWYIATVNRVDGYHQYMWKDLKLHGSTGIEHAIHLTRGSAPGYYATKAEAERYLKAYEIKNLNLIVRRNSINDRYYIVPEGQECPAQYLHKDLKLYCYSGTKGEWKSLIKANRTLRQFKEKHMGFKSAEDKLVISVKLNGVNTPLHEINEETLLRIREASKPKPVPAFQMCNYGCRKRLVFKATSDLAEVVQRNVGNYIFLDSDGMAVGCQNEIYESDFMYTNFRELRLDEV